MAVDSEGFETCRNPQLKNFIVVLIGCISIVNVVIGLGLGVLCDTSPTDMNPSAILSKPNHHRYNKQPLHTPHDYESNLTASKVFPSSFRPSMACHKCLYYKVEDNNSFSIRIIITRFSAFCVIFVQMPALSAVKSYA